MSAAVDRARAATRRVALWCGLVATPLTAQIGPAVLRVDPITGIPGHLVLVGGGGTPDAAREAFAAAAGGRDAPLCVIPTASARADDAAYCGSLVEEWRARGWTDVTVVHTRDRQEAQSSEFLAPLARARAVWISGGQQSRLAEVYASGAADPQHAAQVAIQRVVERGGVVGGTSAGAAIASTFMIAGGRSEPQLGFGLALLNHVIVDQHFRQRERQGRLRLAVDRHALHGGGVLGMGLDERTAVWIHGRDVRVLGDGAVTLRWAAGAGRPAREQLLEPGAGFDLVQVQRAARMRARLLPDPGAVGLPDGGTLMVVGGGRLPEEVLQRFVDAAGGAAGAVVVVPTAGGFEAGRGSRMVDVLRRSGVGDVALFQPESLRAPGELELAKLRRATGVWFDGGRQWRLVDAYADTEVEAAFRAVLERGGVVGGSSAGATIQGELLVRGHPLGNTVMLAEGYLRGFGYLEGVAVDQHFSQRRRLPDLLGVVRRHPDTLGIGLDEGTAIVVRDGEAEVVGTGSAWWVDARSGGEPVVRGFSAGARVRLADPLRD